MYAQHRHLSSGIGRRAVWPARQAAVGSGLRTTRPLVHAVPGPTSLTVKVKAEPLPRVLPPRDGACLTTAFARRCWAPTPPTELGTASTNSAKSPRSGLSLPLPVLC